METVFRAFDGKIFEDEDDCVLYERKEKEKKIHNQYFGMNYAENKIDFSEKSFCDFFNEIQFLIIKTKAAAELLSTAAEEEGYIIPNQIGAFVWDEEENNFINVENKVEKMKKGLSFYERILNMAKED